jgi:hypothetical protein
MMIRRYVLLAVVLMPLIVPAWGQTDAVAGTWQGTLPKANLPLVFKFKADGTGTVDSSKQNFHSAATVTLSGTTVTISVPAVQGTFTGTLADGKETGTWTQGSGYSDDLVLVKQ